MNTCCRRLPTAGAAVVEEPPSRRAPRAGRGAGSWPGRHARHARLGRGGCRHPRTDHWTLAQGGSRGRTTDARVVGVRSCVGKSLGRVRFLFALPPWGHGRRVAWGHGLPQPPSGVASPIAGRAASPTVARSCGCSTLPRLNSEKSNTCGNNVARRIIGGGAPAARPEIRPDRSADRRIEAAAVRRVRVDEGSDGQRLDNFLVKLLKGVPKAHVYRVIRSGEVRVNKGRAGADTRLASGDEVRIPPVRMAANDERPAAPAREFPIVHEDEQLIAIDKPAGVAVHGGSGVSSGVIEQLRQARPEARFLELVHRLDKETSGLLLIAKKRSALVALQDQLRRRDGAVVKTYAALVAGRWPANRKVIDVALHKYLTGDGERRVRAVQADHAEGRRSITLVGIAQAWDGYTLLDVTIKTGRTHQIRVHLTHAGHPIVGDEKYGDFALNKALARGDAVPGCRFERMFLHAARLRVIHPVTGLSLELEAPLPAECEALMHALARQHPPSA
ncbi:MAG: RluA family pseudouridine synthase [Proteobacteria bacterium]|nr:RluA family pseudouridine synthase [Pseudomonadota bacterium]